VCIYVTVCVCVRVCVYVCVCVCPTLCMTVCYSYLYFICSACECSSAVTIFLVLNDCLLLNRINVLCIFKHVSERSSYKLLIYI
jgi:hypothetical protein